MIFQWFLVYSLSYEYYKNDPTKFGADHTRIWADIINTGFLENSPKGLAHKKIPKIEVRIFLQYFLDIHYPMDIMKKDYTKFGEDHTRIGADIIIIGFSDNSPRG